MKLHWISAAWIGCIALLIASTQMVYAQNDIQFFTYFLDEPPTKVDLAQLPPTARDVIIARVRIVKGPNYFAVDRDEVYRGKYYFGARLAVTSVLEGQSKIGESYDVKFGIRGLNISLYIYPHTPHQKA